MTEYPRTAGKCWTVSNISVSMETMRGVCVWGGSSVVLTLCSPVDCSLPGSSVHGSFQARILEWVATFYSREPSWPRGHTRCLLHLLHWQADSSPLASLGKAHQPVSNHTKESKESRRSAVKMKPSTHQWMPTEEASREAWISTPAQQ